MEYSQTICVRKIYTKKYCLNPYSNGILTDKVVIKILRG